MIYAVFLCDKKWKIKLIRQCVEELSLNEGDNLTSLILETDQLTGQEEGQYSTFFTFKEYELHVSVLIRCFKEGNLIILSRVTSEQEFVAFNNAYPGHVEWAKDHLIGLFHDGYFRIQQMNNQLIDAQRALVRSNKRLEQSLKENREINEQLEKARAEAEQAMREAEKASRSKSDFLANMSHDIRTPMNAIVGIASLMEYQMGNPGILRNYISKLQYSSQYLLDLINDILDLSKIENGSLELKIEPMNIEKQIEQIHTIILSRITERRQNLTVKADQIEHKYIKGDPIRLRQILMNILSNAVKYTPEGGDINFYIQEVTENPGYIQYRFIIEDTGMGMSKAFMKRIFEPFSRAEDKSTEIQGTGLGMAITKSIVDAMGGTISVESTPGKGSRFEVTLTFEKSMENEVTDEGQERPKNLKETEENEECRNEEKVADLTGKRFLCAEDNELNAEILKSMLEYAGASCVIYVNGQLLADAFAEVKPGEYDAVLMDVQMPVMDGYEATRQIRTGKNPLGKTIPIIAMTANAFSEDIQKSLNAGMNAHISKPIELHTLESTLRNIMERR